MNMNKKVILANPTTMYVEGNNCQVHEDKIRSKWEDIIRLIYTLNPIIRLQWAATLGENGTVGKVTAKHLAGQLALIDTTRHVGENKCHFYDAIRPLSPFPIPLQQSQPAVKIAYCLPRMPPGINAALPSCQLCIQTLSCIGSLRASHRRT